MTIHQKFTGDPSQLLKAYQDLAGANARLESQVSKLAGTMGIGSNTALKGQTALNAAVREGISEVQNFAAQWVGLGSAITAVKFEFDEINDRRQRAASTGVTVGSSQADIVRNMTGVSTETKKQFVQDVHAAFTEVKFPDLANFNRAAASGLSASAGDTKGVLQALKAGGQLSRDTPQDLALLVGAALDIEKASGIKDAERNLSFLAKVGGQNRLVDSRAQAANVPGALTTAANTVKDGDRQRATIEGGALFASLGSVGNDTRGESTRTAVQSFTVQLRDFFEKGVERTVNGRKFYSKPAIDPGSIGGRIDLLQNDEKQRKKFLEHASFERQFQVPVEQLLAKGGITNKLYREAVKQIDFDRGEFDQQVKDLQGLTPATRLATVDAASRGQLQTAELENSREGRIAKAIEIRDKALREARAYSPQMFGLKYVTDQGENLFDASKNMLDGRDPLQDSVNRLQRRRQDILQPGSLLGGRDNFAAARTVEQLNADERIKLKFVEEQLALLKQLVAEDAAANQALQEQNALLKEIRDQGINRQPAAEAAGAARAERGRNREQ